jgi:hypothetical protein
MEFDWKFYISYYDDLKNLKTYTQAISHYNSFGKKEHRLINKEQTECFGKELNQVRISKGISNLPDNLNEISTNEISTNEISTNEISTIYLKDGKYYLSKKVF